MHGRVARRSPTRPLADETGVIFFPDEELASRDAGTHHLRVTTQTHIRIGLREHFLIDGPVRCVTGRAAFAQGRVFEDDALRLLAMTRGALLVQSRHRETARWFHNVEAVRVMALDAIHFAFAHGMVLREVELRVNFEMTREASLRVLSGIDDELSFLVSRRDVFAAGAVARFAAGTARHFRGLDVQTRVWTRREDACVLRVAIGARRVADKSCAGNFRPRRDVA